MGIYGYTHRKAEDVIGSAVKAMVDDFPLRVSILRSDKPCDDLTLPGAYTVPTGEIPRSDIIVCPQQTGKTESCLTCGLCFNGITSVQFLEH